MPFPAYITYIYSIANCFLLSIDKMYWFCVIYDIKDKSLLMLILLISYDLYLILYYSCKICLIFNTFNLLFKYQNNNN